MVTYRMIVVASQMRSGCAAYTTTPEADIACKHSHSQNEGADNLRVPLTYIGELNAKNA